MIMLIVIVMIMWPFDRTARMHCLGEQLIIIVMIISIAYIAWSGPGPGSALGANGANHAFVKVTMVSLRRRTVFCDHLPQAWYHQVHQVFSDSNSLTLCSKSWTRFSRSATLVATFACGDLERRAGTHPGQSGCAV